MTEPKQSISLDHAVISFAEGVAKSVIEFGRYRDLNAIAQFVKQTIDTKVAEEVKNRSLRPVDAPSQAAPATTSHAAHASSKATTTTTECNQNVGYVDFLASIEQNQPMAMLSSADVVKETGVKCSFCPVVLSNNISLGKHEARYHPAEINVYHSETLKGKRKFKKL